MNKQTNQFYLATHKCGVMCRDCGKRDQRATSVFCDKCTAGFEDHTETRAWRVDPCASSDNDAFQKANIYGDN